MRRVYNQLSFGGSAVQLCGGLVAPYCILMIGYLFWALAPVSSTFRFIHLHTTHGHNLYSVLAVAKCARNPKSNQAVTYVVLKFDSAWNPYLPIVKTHVLGCPEQACVCVDFSYCSLCNRDNVVVILVCSPTMFSEKKMVVGRIFLMFTAVGVMSTQDFECPFLGPWALGAQPPSRKASHLDTCGR